MTVAAKTKKHRAAKILASLACVLSVGIWSAEAGEFSENFDSGLPTSCRLLGDALHDPVGGVNKSGVLKLTRSKPTLVGSCVIDSPEGTADISGFTASFKTFIGGGSGGYGMAFCVAPDLPETAFDEKGAGSGLIVSFHTAIGSEEAPRGIRVVYGNSTITNAPFSGLRANRFVDTIIRWDPSNGLEVTYNGQTLITGLELPGASSLTGKFGFGARTGAVTDWHCVDDLNIATQVAMPSFLLSCAPAHDHAAPDALIEFAFRHPELIDFESVRMTLDDVAAEPKLTTNDAGGATFYYQPSALLDPGSAHTVRVTFSERKDPGTTKSFSYRFTVSPHIAITK